VRYTKSVGSCRRNLKEIIGMKNSSVRGTGRGGEIVSTSGNGQRVSQRKKTHGEKEVRPRTLDGTWPGATRRLERHRKGIYTEKLGDRSESGILGRGRERHLRTSSKEGLPRMLLSNWGGTCKGFEANSGLPNRTILRRSRSPLLPAETDGRW